ncbi:hypothetical protein ACJ2A9_05095 [Anaerobacillus sp. MEB173]|uniref:hypothetical protein n=1 Tax=Anaerobacillus sp. MEB173 TaxID=3383345 RepID=UPI003F91BA99
MEKKKVQLKEDLEVSYYSFSDDIICVEVFYKQKEMGAFCSDISHFKEWDETDLLQLAESHVKNNARILSTATSSVQRKALDNGIEVEYYSHSDDILCIEMFKDGHSVGSFCSDVSSFEEWMEDDELLKRVVEKQLPQGI